VEVDNRPVRNAREFERIYDDLAPGKTFLVKVLGSDGQSTMVTALEKPE